MRHNRWATLTVLALAQFMVVLDVTIVNVALPDIQRDLGFAPDDLQWVISAYTLLFGGFLLLGGRAGDLLGRRRVFMAGLALFGAASLTAAFATSPEMLVAARAAQGLGGALLSPVALSILMVTFAHGRERNLAMGVWGGLAALGGTLGVILGGVLVDGLGWESIFWINVPVAIALVAIAPLIVRESRADGAVRSFDVAGALLGTGGLLALVWGVIRAEPLGWGAAEVVAALAGGVALLGAFLAIESRAAAPLVPLRLFASRGMRISSTALALNGGAFLAMFFLTAIFLQQVRGDSALQAGLHFLPMGVAAVAGATVASNLVTRIGTRPVHFAGALVSVTGLLLLSRAGAGGTYAAEILPGIVLFGAGIMGIAVANQIAAVAEVRPEEAGAASGVVTAAYQVGGALGLAIVTTLSTAHAESALAGGADPVAALVDGFERGMLVAAVLAAINVAVGFVAPRIAPTAEQLAEAQATA
ncbi:MAG TPA: MFS transporter [Capillimicrobium sp.]|nr:MFS transporter [Capillimicrobium sp.]